MREYPSFLGASEDRLEPLECDEEPRVRRAERVSAPPEVVERSLFRGSVSSTCSNLQGRGTLLNPL
jgi:hypothetical protein